MKRFFEYVSWKVILVSVLTGIFNIAFTWFVLDPISNMLKLCMVIC